MAALATFVAPLSLHLGLFDALRQPALIFGALLLPLALFVGRWRDAATILLGIILLMAPWAATGTLPLAAGDRQISLIVLPTTTDEALAYAMDRQADVLVVPDFSERHHQITADPTSADPGLEILARDYQPPIVSATGGQGVFLRRGIAEIDSIRLRPSLDMRALVFDARLRGVEMTFAIAHLDRPAPIGALGRQAAEVRMLCAQLSGIRRPIVLAGDFNALPWSAALDELATAIEAEEPRWVGTFPTTSPIRLAIDQIWVGRGLGLQSLKAGPDVGSVHLPLEAVVSLAAP